MLELLKKAELFQRLLDDDLLFISTLTEEKQFSVGDTVFQKGGAALHFYVVRTGEILIQQVGEDGRRVDLARYTDGDSFGDFTFITNALYDVEARVSKDSTLLVFPAFPNTLDSISLEKPDTVSRLYLNALTILSQRLRAIYNLIEQNTFWVKQLQEQMYRDELTGLYTRQYLEAEASRYLKPGYCFVCLKPDNFKLLNDAFGHQAGDAVLQKIGHLLRRHVNAEQREWAVRLRGNEMALVWRGAERKNLLRRIKTVTTELAKIGPRKVAVAGKGVADFCLTSSVGVGFYRSRGSNWCEVLDKTCELMRSAWHKGGNRIIILK